MYVKKKILFLLRVLINKKKCLQTRERERERQRTNYICREIISRIFFSRLFAVRIVELKIKKNNWEKNIQSERKCENNACKYRGKSWTVFFFIVIENTLDTCEWKYFFIYFLN